MAEVEVMSPRPLNSALNIISYKPNMAFMCASVCVSDRYDRVDYRLVVIMYWWGIRRLDGGNIIGKHAATAHFYQPFTLLRKGTGTGKLEFVLVLW